MVTNIAFNVTEDNIFNVTYQLQTSKNVFEIEGIMSSYFDGRIKRFKFEPSEIPEEISEYYDKLWEDINEEIIDAFDKFVFTNKLRVY